HLSTKKSVGMAHRLCLALLSCHAANIRGGGAAAKSHRSATRIFHIDIRLELTDLLVRSFLGCHAANIRGCGTAAKSHRSEARILHSYRAIELPDVLFGLWVSWKCQETANEQRSASCPYYLPPITDQHFFHHSLAPPYITDTGHVASSCLWCILLL